MDGKNNLFPFWSKGKDFVMDTIIQMKYGLLQGKREENMVSFLGIPYAKAPVGELRWHEPVELNPWEGVREALELGSPSLQHNGQAIPGGDPAERGVFNNDSEDCLYLNVWSPAVTSDDRLPVFVWIHGGAFCCGSGGGKSASPEPFCSRGIVYVTFNYRLGLMGYFVHPELAKESEHNVSGNYAHFDQLMALKWVKENIASFGGDPNNITVGGCSAGCGSTQVLCNSPLAKGLFQKAVLESTVALAGAMYPEDFKLSEMKEMEDRGVEFMELLGCNSIEEMRSMTFEELTAPEESKFRRKFHYGTTIGTCADGYLLPKHYSWGNVMHKNADIPYIVGNTHDENGGFVFFKDIEGFRQRNLPVFGKYTDEYLTLCNTESLDKIKESMRNSHLLLARSKVFAERNAEVGRKPVWVFDFCRKNSVNGEAHHGLETQYLLGTFTSLPGVTEKDGKLAKIMQEYWCNFIQNGDPNGEGLLHWSPYTKENRKVLYLDCPEVTVGDDAVCEHPLLTYTRKRLEEKLENNY